MNCLTVPVFTHTEHNLDAVPQPYCKHNPVIFKGYPAGRSSHELSICVPQLAAPINARLIRVGTSMDLLRRIPWVCVFGWFFKQIVISLRIR